MDRLVRYVDTEDGVALFVTPSWTGKDETYEITVDVASWMIRCDCFGSNRHKLYEDLLHPGKSHGCKHARAVARFVKRHMEL